MIMVAELHETLGEDGEMNLLALAARRAPLNPAQNMVVNEEADALGRDDYQVIQDGLDQEIGLAGAWERRLRRKRKGVSAVSRLSYFIASSSIGVCMTLAFWSVTEDLIVLSAGLSISVVFPLGVALAFDGGFRRWWLRLKFYGFLKWWLRFYGER